MARPIDDSEERLKMNVDYDIDPALVAEFVDESLDFLSEMDGLFVQLEESSGEISIIESIFRPIHSIKGNSSFFGYMQIKNLAHEMETLLDLLRKEQLSISGPLIDILLEGVDNLKSILLRCRASEEEILDEAAFDDLITRVKAQAHGEDGGVDQVLAKIAEKLEEAKATVSTDAESAAAAIEAALAIINESTKSADAVEEAPSDGRDVWPAPVREILKLINESTTEAGDAVLGHLKSLTEFTEDDSLKSEINEMVDTFVTFMDSVGYDNLLKDITREKIEELNGLHLWIVEEEEEGPEAEEAAESSQALEDSKAPEKSGTEPQKTMRVPEASIDTFLAFVGELLVVGDMFGHLHKRVEESSSDWDLLTSFRVANDTFAGLSDQLQASIMSIRKVSMNMLLQKVPRLVRDIAANAGKEIKVEIIGAEIDVDKSLIDLLDAPLTHMVRNAADHGVENPEERLGKGKPAEGTIVISVEERENNIHLTVKDDGAGLNLEAIKNKAVSLELLSPGQELTNDDIVNLIFSSGVSTAEAVTDVSGRGVGMDVVRRMIEEAGGSISVKTESGVGSSFILTLPMSVTTQIMQGFLVESGGQSFVLPMSKVHETVVIHEDEITTIPGENRCINRHDKIVPLISLRNALGITDANGNGAAQNKGIVISVESQDGIFGLQVDDVLGVQKVVLREINGLETTYNAISGGALMGDGSVTLFLDVDQLSRAREFVEHA
jgi:two-component system chemotaxis sensor kinase CheA